MGSDSDFLVSWMSLSEPHIIARLYCTYVCFLTDHLPEVQKRDIPILQGLNLYFKIVFGAKSAIIRLQLWCDGDQ